MPSPFDVLSQVGGPSLPLLGHVPHAGIHIPHDVRESLLIAGEDLSREIDRVTDHLTDVLFGAVLESGGCLFVNRLSRLVFDPERFREDERESQSSVGAGAIYTKTSMGVALRKPDHTQRESLLRRFYDPYAEAISDATDTMLIEFGSCWIVDCHSFPTEPLPWSADTSPDRPDLCFGTHPYHTPERLVSLLQETAESRGMTSLINAPYSGTYVPSKHLEKDGRVHSVMIEVRRDLYLDESTSMPSHRFDECVETVGDLISVVAGEARDST